MKREEEIGPFLLGVMTDHPPTGCNFKRKIHTMVPGMFFAFGAAQYQYFTGVSS